MRTKKQSRPVLAEAFGPTIKPKAPEVTFREVTEEDWQKEWLDEPKHISISLDLRDLVSPPPGNEPLDSLPMLEEPETPKPTPKKKKTPKPQQHKDTTPSVEDLELEYLLIDEGDKESPPEG